MVRVKICGITNIDDAAAAVEFGADALGFVFYKASPRHVAPEEARKIILELPPFVTTVGVFVDEERAGVEKTLLEAGIDVAQLHGDEPPEDCAVGRRAIKAIRVRDMGDVELLRHYSVSAYLLDTYSPDVPGGTGQTFNWDIAVEAKAFGRIILAGGLSPENVSEAVAYVRPFAVDVSSGVEAEKGKKDLSRMKLFIERAKGALPL
jgi:phosphoribosylanthranilate isomerase